MEDEQNIIKEVNESVNSAITWKRDDAAGKWQSPAETISRGLGDCEDFAILKWSLLAEKGIESWLAYTFYTKLPLSDREAHMVLLVENPRQACWMVLDNLFGDIKPLHERSDLSMIYRFNETGLVVNGDDERLRDLKSLPAFEKILRDEA